VAISDEFKVGKGENLFEQDSHEVTTLSSGLNIIAFTLAAAVKDKG